MAICEDVLKMLENADEAMSGEEIAQRLGVSRNSVWKAVNRLKEEGYKISAVTNKGYTLVSEGDSVSDFAVKKYLKSNSSNLRIMVRDEVTSTQTVLKELGDKGEEGNLVLIAHRQTAGKGRLGRSFEAPKNSGLYMSILLRPAIPAEKALFITTAAAAATSKAIKTVTDKETQIKWVNDVYYQGKKICGILTEANLDFESGGLNYAVLGIGVNITAPPGGFPKEISDVATALYTKEPPEQIRAKLAAEILSNFMEYYNDLESKAFMEEYRKRSFLTGREIVFTQGNISETGRVLDIDDNARLVVKLDSGETKTYMAGEVSIVKNFT